MHAIYFPISPPSPRFSLRSQTKDRRWAETVLAFPQYFSLRGCNGLEVSEWASVSVTITPASVLLERGGEVFDPFLRSRSGSVGESRLARLDRLHRLSFSVAVRLLSAETLRLSPRMGFKYTYSTTHALIL